VKFDRLRVPRILEFLLGDGDGNYLAKVILAKGLITFKVILLLFRSFFAKFINC
jgi:hypothetical protein